MSGFVYGHALGTALVGDFYWTSGNGDVWALLLRAGYTPSEDAHITVADIPAAAVISQTPVINRRVASDGWCQANPLMFFNVNEAATGLVVYGPMGLCAYWSVAVANPATGDLTITFPDDKMFRL
jgi:hypothetical protein